MATTLLTSCGSNNGYEPAVRQPSKETTEKKKKDSRNLYLIDEMDMAGESITLESLNSSDKIVKYKYSLKTRFLNKYGENSSWNNFTPGRIVTIKNGKSGGLDEVRISDKAWEKDVKNFTIDELNGIFTIGKTDYRIGSKTKVFSDGVISDINTISQNDELRLVGIDKDLFSIEITTGHGILELQNTEVFVDSMISVGSRIFTRITGDGMQIEVPEGTYTVTVANDGYGGSKDVTIKRGDTSVLDLNELKGEGPKYSQITFHVAVDNASIFLDGKKITEDQATEDQQDEDTNIDKAAETDSADKTGDTSVTIQVKYGRHAIKVEASGYNAWERTLIVNSPTADITLDLSDEKNDSANMNSNNSTKTRDSSNSDDSTSGSSSNSSRTENDNSTKSNNSSSNSDSGSKGSKSLYNGTNYGTTSDGTSTENKRNAAMSDYLQTMQDMIKSISGDN